MEDIKIITRAKLKCPECGHIEEVEMPTDSCMYFYECVKCHKIIKPKKGDCCVFCSYADVPCPSKQLQSRQNSE